MDEARLICGDAVEVLPTLPAASVDCIVTDPPYPCIKRPYGTWTEPEWFDLMRAVVPECMRVLKPRGSAVFILQPNSERVGRMRTWLLEFQLWVAREWGIVQDAYWWNHVTLPSGGATECGLLRPSLKACVWVGPPSCHRDQDAVLWSESEENRAERLAGRCGRVSFASNARSITEQGRMVRERVSAAAARRGGVTPFNVLLVQGGDRCNGHSASTPLALCDWWLRYLCPPGGACLDPFSGSGTVGVAAVKQGKGYVGIERDRGYHRIAQKRIAEARALQLSAVE